MSSVNPTQPPQLAEADLPEGWALAKLSDVTHKVPNIKPEEEPERVFQYVDISGVDNDAFQIVETKEFPGTEAPSRARRPIKAGDVLFSNVRTYLKNIAVVPSQLDGQVASTGFTVLRPNGAVLTDFLYRWVLTDRFVDAVTPQQTGSSYPATTDRVVREQMIPLPPLAEQERIVAKVEALLSRLRSVRQRLAATGGILKHFRQAVLAHACSGKLTEAWRANRDVESAEMLLTNAVREKDFRHQDACRTAESEGRRKPPKPKGLKPTPVRTSDLPVIPDEWVWTTFDHVAHDITVGFVGPMQSEYQPTGVPFLRSLNVRGFRFEPKDLKFVSREFHQRLGKSALHPGDIVTVRSGNPGTTCVIPPELADANCSDLVITRPTSSLVPQYAAIFINSEATLRHIESVKVGIAQGHFNIGSMRETPLALPPVAEQQEIVRRVEVLFALASSIEQHVQAATKRAEALTQSILARAFRGELVPTEADLARAEGRDYEPAEQLLARIRAEGEVPVEQVKARKTRSTRADRPAKGKRGIAYKRAALAAYAIDRLHERETFGRTQLEKVLYLTQHHLGIDLMLEFKRLAAGPFDEAVIRMESLAAKRGWFATRKRKPYGYRYHPGHHIEDRLGAARHILGNRLEEMDRLMGWLAEMNTEQAELMATTFAAWNDLLIDGRQSNDADIVAEVRGWDESKQRFSPERIQVTIAWLRDKGFVPRGIGPHTLVARDDHRPAETPRRKTTRKIGHS